MTIQVLVATMNQRDHSLLEKMNIKTDAVIANQCDHDSIERFVWNGHNIIYVNTTTKGVGLNRNLGILFSSADYLLFSDDDVVYNDDYSNVIMEELQSNQFPDLMICDMVLYMQGDKKHTVTSKGKVSLCNSGKYGACNICAKRLSLIWNNIFFHEMFGGGTVYSAGEDSIFIVDCLKKHLTVVSSTECIAINYQGPSTWFNGINSKLCHDRGVVFKYMYGIFAFPVAVFHVIKNANVYEEHGILLSMKEILQGSFFGY